MYNYIDIQQHFLVLTKCVRVIAMTKQQADSIKEELRVSLSSDSDVKWLKPKSSVNLKDDTIYVYTDKNDLDQYTTDVRNARELITLDNLIIHLIR